MLMIPPPMPRTRREPRKPAVGVAVENANLQRVLLLSSGALLLMFDGPVTVNALAPPTTWSFNGITAIVPGAALDFGTSTYIIVDAPINSGDPVIFAANDPGARTPDGGYVNAVTMAVSAL